MGVKVKSRRQQAAPAPEVAPRRVPMQERARQRVDGILDAAAHVFDEVGYEAATTNAIAARAGVSIGSIYQFFPNKSALLNALAARYRDEVRVLFQRMTGPGVERLPLRDSLGQLIDAVVQLHRTRPGYRAMMQVARSTPERIAGVEQLNALFERRVSEILAVRAPRLSPEDREIAAGVAVHTVDALMLLAAKRSGTSGARVVTQIKLLLERYLSPIEEPAPAARKRDKQG